jgi:hypothetical protein
MGTDELMVKEQPHHVARVLDRSQDVLAAARAARERSEEIRLQMAMTKWHRAPSTVDPATEAVLRATLCEPPRWHTRESGWLLVSEIGWRAVSGR